MRKKTIGLVLLAVFAVLTAGCGRLEREAKACAQKISNERTWNPSCWNIERGFHCENVVGEDGESYNLNLTTKYTTVELFVEFLHDRSKRTVTNLARPNLDGDISGEDQWYPRDGDNGMSARDAQKFFDAGLEALAARCSVPSTGT